MSDRSLVDIENALTRASEAITEQVTGLLDAVNDATPTWTPETPSRVAQQRHETRLRDGLARLTEALDQVRGEVAAHRERAREAEVENVAIVG